jgi:hypothetical protein
MAVTFDKVDGDQGTTGTSISWTHTPVGTPTGVAVVVGWNSVAQSITSVTYGGQACTLKGTSDNPGANAVAAIYGLANPPSGAQTVQANFSGSVTGAGYSVTVLGGNTSQVFNAAEAAKATGDSGTSSISVTSAVDELVIDAVVANPSGGEMTAGAGQAERGAAAFGGDRLEVSTEAGAASVDMTWTFTTTEWSAIGASFAAEAESTPQLLAPIQDISAGPWLTSSGSPAELWQMIDGEESPDFDYDYTTSAGTMEVKLASGSTPSLQTGHTLRYRLRGNGTCDALVKLKCGSTVISQWTETNVPAVDTDYEHTLDSSPSFTISDYTDLRISVEAVP